MRRLIPWCRSRAVPIIVDAVEWYKSSHLPGGMLGPFSVSNALAMRRYYPKARNVIAISRFLEQHFEERGCNVVRVPPTRDVAGTTVRLEERPGSLRLAYAGVPGRKDLLDNIVQGIININRGHPEPRAELAIAGPSVSDVMSMPALRATGLRSLPPWLMCHGRMSPEGVNALLRGADFMPLLRPYERYSMAGFPTKVPESLAAGTPVICNLTSDLADYLADGREALLCGDSSATSFAETLERAIALSIRQRTDMRVHARRRAEASFDYRNYVGDIERFLGSLRLLH
jgi:glycosyltransferase involved in cell wall biosynthesis